MGLAALSADIGRRLDGHAVLSDAAGALARAAVARVPGVEWASITRGRRGSFTTIAATHPAASTVDDLQYELGGGPCVDAIVQQGVLVTGDLAADPRWPELGRHAAAAVGVRSMLSFRLFFDDDELIAGLNLYATRADAFDDGSLAVGTLLATQGALAFSAALARERAGQLQQALTRSRDIGVAIGVLMARLRIPRTQAFDLLRTVSQHTNRKLASIAAEIAETGTVDLPEL
jgi:GAF domain-containing protein